MTTNKTLSMEGAAAKRMVTATILPRLRSADMPVEEGVITNRFLDLQVEYYIPILTSGPENISFVLTKSNLEVAGMTLAEVHAAACKNLDGFISREETVEAALSDMESPLVLEPGTERLGLIRLKNYMPYGAAGMLLGNRIHRMALKFESDIYIIPSSIHEILCMKAEGSPHEEFFLKQMIMSVNRTMLEKNDILSYNLYHYWPETNVLEIVGGDPSDSNNTYKY